MKNISTFSYRISKLVGKAINDYNMIEENDKILLGFSGGKDSFTLLDILSKRLKWIPIKYELYALLVILNSSCSSNINIQLLKNECEKRNINFIIKKIDIDKAKSSPCFWCSWNRRKILFTTCEELKCKKLALAHHKDDIIETLLLNLFYHGDFSTMPPKLDFFNGKITLIRPLCYVEEKYTERYAKENNFIYQKCNENFLANTKRELIKQIIRELKIKIPSIKGNLFNSMKKIRKKDYLL